MKFLQKQPRAALLGVLLVIIAGVAALYLVSSADEPTQQDTTAGNSPVRGEDGSETPPGGQHSGGSTGARPVPGGETEADIEEILGNQSDELPPISLDIDSDGTMETIILNRGEGEAQPLDWFLVDNDGGEAVLLFSREGVVHGEVTVDGPRIIETEGIFGAGDDPCCPSQAKKTYYVWQDGGLLVSRIEAAPVGPPAP